MSFADYLLPIFAFSLHGSTILISERKIKKKGQNCTLGNTSFNRKDFAHTRGGYNRFQK